MGKREDLFLVTVIATRVIDGVEEKRNLGIFDSWEGGEIEAEDTTYRRGGLAEQESLGGSKSVGNVTVGRIYDDFMQEQEPWLEQGTGKARISGTKQPLDEDGNVKGKPRTYSGKLVGLTPPDHDSESSDAARIELVISPHGAIG